MTGTSCDEEKMSQVKIQGFKDFGQIYNITIVQLASSQFTGATGGPSTFGYDAASVCGKPYSRNGRAYLEKLPCDFRRQNWCTVAGNFYPWHAVKRFVKENQGLMRRMYGDETHISVLKTELEKNDIDIEFDERYRRSFDKSSSFDDEYDFEIDEDEGSEVFKSHENIERSPKFKDFTRSQSQPNEMTTPFISISSAEIFSSTENPVKITQTPSMSNISTPNSSVKYSQNNYNASQKTLVDKINITSNLALSEIARVKNSSINEIPSGNLLPVNDVVFNVTDIPSYLELLRETTLESDESTRTSTTIASIDRVDENIDNKEFSDKIDINNEKIFVANEEEKIDEFKPRPEYRPSEIKPESISNLEGQLFQDVAAKEQINQKEQPVLKLRGINACPVKEEVVAPFWANNTRGEVLALLNLYPFEQYVHWEKCTHEKKQMYCRDGCRCEQQYRLHRLLAYDPNNECRGIFSDWFKFPSCCVCRCYDLPIEFRVTSRSPRAQRQKLKLRSKENRRT
ncbi:hypothetical protein PV328_005818 [Microctonus aethiopoides]|uniref:Spaetzle domain-containing protein n=1 Tax=Microctonus aethiopoides TaxID=144406 RepID=A0AA39KSU0_9HYME|nr:hypothetical protein PV328_005818 [Microctonus aethiopoides]